MTMKSTGIVRRIDDFGRVVLPKEIRRTMSIRDGDPMEIYIDSDQIILKKYSPIQNLNQDLMREYASTLKNVSGCSVIITDTDMVLIDTEKRLNADAALTRDFKSLLLDEKKSIACKTKEECIRIMFHEKEDHDYVSQMMRPICVNGDIIGAVILYSKEKDIVTDINQHFINLTAGIIANQAS